MDNISHHKVKQVQGYASNKGFKQTFNRLFFIEKLYNTTGIVLLSIVGIIIAVGTAFIGPIFGILLILIITVPPIVYCLVVYPKFGIVVLIVMAYMLFMLGQLGVEGPVGTLMDALQVLLILGVLIKNRKERNWAIFKSPVTIVIFIWLGYNILELGNPAAESRLAWLYTIRSVAIVALSYFVFMYHIRTIQFIRLIFIVWFILTIIGAVYGFKQEYIGFNAHEEAYVNSPGIPALLFIDGHWRKFSIFSDPVAFAYNMVMPSIFIICLVTMNMQLWKKIALGFLALIFLDAMLFSGTRGANILIPAALILFAILKYNKKILMYSCMGGVFILILVNMPTSNPNLMRFQTAFKPNNDDSYNLRKRNQKSIQPYILTHPMGGGLGATGVWGQRFAPWSYLANFPPDSGYMRVAVEDGWLGLLLFCIFMFVILKTGINNFYLIQDPELKTYCLAMTLIVFAYNLANFPQEALVQFPSNILFYLWAALINITRRLDIKLQEEKSILLQLQHTL